MGVYTGIGGSARPAKALYVGFADIARKVSAAYVGIAGLAKKIFSASVRPEAIRVGYATPLSEGRYWAATASAAGGAFIAGGQTGDTSGHRSTVELYDFDLNKTAAPALSAAVSQMGGAAIGEYAIFAGGYLTVRKSAVTTYGLSAVKGTATALTEAKAFPTSFSTETYAVFAGGSQGASGNISAGAYRSVDAYPHDLIKKTAALPAAQASSGVAAFRNHGIIAGGNDSNNGVMDTVLVLDDDMIVQAIEPLSVARTNVQGFALNGYAVFAGGYSGNYGNRAYSTVDAYTSAFVKVAVPQLTVPRYYAASGSFPGFALAAIAGGFNSVSTTSAGVTNVVETWDDSLVHSISDPLLQGRSKLGSVVIGDRLLFVGGYGSSTLVDVYQIK